MSGHDNVYELASNALKDAQEEIRTWRIKAEDYAKDLEEAHERIVKVQQELAHFKRMAEIHDQIIEQKDAGLRGYRSFVADLQGSGIIARYSEEITGLQTKLKFALALVPRGDSEVFTFENGDTAEYGQDTQYSEAMLDYWCQAHPIAMGCINKMHAKLGNLDEATREPYVQLIQACKHALEKVHERTQVGNEICPFSGMQREKRHWLNEEDDDE